MLSILLTIGLQCQLAGVFLLSINFSMNEILSQSVFEIINTTATKIKETYVTVIGHV